MGVVVGIVAGDPSSLGAAEASMALRLRASGLGDEMTVVSEVPTDILVSDLSMTRRNDITHNTVEGIMYKCNRVVLHPSTLHK